MTHKESNNTMTADFDAGPSSVNEIETGLFLGNLTAATDIQWLKTVGITHMLTLDSCPVPRQIQECSPDLIIKYIQITDMPREDLLTHFGDTYDFINRALESNGKILVHCYAGVSRSAAIVIAYTMKKYDKTFSQAFEFVKNRRRFVGPNPGFVAQLKLYEDMGFRIDNTSIQFKMYKLQIAADKVRKARILPQICTDLIKPDPALTTSRPEPTVYRCKKCRRIVASASNVLPHMPREKQIWRHISTKRKPNQIKTDPQQNVESGSVEFCNKIHFIEPLGWMPDILHNVEGKLNCPQCNTKLGCFSWIAGCQCPCGSTIAPAFYLVPSKVDWSNIVQNVQTWAKLSPQTADQSNYTKVMTLTPPPFQNFTWLVWLDGTQVGESFKKGISMSKGSFDSGKVISQLGEGNQTTHIAYRKSKLIKFLQDSLGTNGVTLMIACVSLAGYSIAETIRTFRYADSDVKLKRNQ